MVPKTSQIHIVLVEDNPADVVLARMTLDAIRKSEQECCYQLTVLSDGARAVAYFADQSVPPPDLVILDLNLPKVSGFEVLERIRQQSMYQDLDVIILSSSDAAADRQRAEKLGVRRYFHKPESLPGYQELAEQGRELGRQLLARKR